MMFDWSTFLRPFLIFGSAALVGYLLWNWPVLTLSIAGAIILAVSIWLWGLVNTRPR